ncbi:MAG TPA: tetratricopeptide repeat protein, partial [Pyrinomonadaceae bacterium]|nr:tetratricopeptide repeat protein [Pyrinomonadaceae bacterium]
VRMPKAHYNDSCMILTAALLICTLTISIPAQEGGGTLPRDIPGGAALIFRKPENPPVGGGRLTERQEKQAPRPTSKAQDQIIARGNAARSAPTPRYSEAEEEYRQAARLDPMDARAYAGLGNVYVDQGRYADAVEQYVKAVKLREDYTDALMPLGYSLVRMNRYDDAIAAYNQTLRYEPDNPEIHNNLSYIFNHTNRYDDAIESSRRAISLLGETGQAYKQGYQTRNQVLSHAYKNLGNAYTGLKRYNEAADALKQATLIEPNNAAAHFNLGLTLYTGGRYSEAIQAYKEVVRLRPTLAPGHFNLALAYIAINNRDAAVAEYETLKSLDSKMAAQLYSLIKK